MKVLKNIKLINWHRFENLEPITIDNFTLFSGENGAGKTTLLDAIMYVLLATSNHFNSAAHLNGKRGVTTYVRSKTGDENTVYERSGSISSHIALEFFEEESNSYFILGAVIDSSSENQEQTCRYLINNKRLSEISFVCNNKPRAIRDFRAVNNIDKKNWFLTQKEARAAFSNRLGRIENRFFELIPKAVAFRPIDDIKDFVYSYVLDEKDINVDNLREYVQSYQELLELLNRTEQEIGELELINQAHQEVLNKENQSYLYDYFIAQASIDLNKENINKLSHNLDLLNDEIKTSEEKIDDLKAQERNTRTEVDDLNLELSNNEDFRALKNLKNKLSEKRASQKLLVAKVKELKNKAQNALINLKNNNLLKKDLIESYKKFLEDFINTNKTEITSSIKILIQDVISNKSEIKERLNKELIELKNNLNLKQNRENYLKEEIEKLKNNQRSYPANMEMLYKQLQLSFKEVGKQTKPIILCEALEIEDETWRNAVEGYLNKQRFYILVSPDDYDYSLALYDQLRSQKQISDVGLVNTNKLERYEKIPENSLASVVSTPNPYLRRYINMVLGKVHLSKSPNELKEYKAAITKEGLKYQSHVASVINPKIYETPWIGTNSYKMQLNSRENELKELSGEIKKLKIEISGINEKLKITETENEYFLLYNLDDFVTYQKLNREISQLDKECKELEKNQTLILKQNQINILENRLETLNLKIREMDQKIGQLLQRKEDKEEDLRFEKRKAPDLTAELIKILAEGKLDKDQLDKEYQKRLKDNTFTTLIKNYEIQRKGVFTSIQKARENLINLMNSFKMSHQFGAPALPESYPEYHNYFKKLKDTRLVEYREQVENARKNAEIEFKEQFLSKLQENIHQAQNEFKELNKALKNVNFNSEKYRFLLKPHPDRIDYYKMIMDPHNIGTSLFQGNFYNQYKDEISNLFDVIKTEDNFNVNTLTDYRNYLSFDIEILDENGNKSFYSKVCREKSGGETQTPFYVAIAASFVQLYSNSISNEAAGIILFDEAFNNMDDERINGVLEFFKQLPLQVIISAPPDKIQYIAPYMDQTNIITNIGKHNFIHEYSNLNLKEA